MDKEFGFSIFIMCFAEKAEHPPDCSFCVWTRLQLGNPVYLSVNH
jgi:hypothetical protein